MHAYYEKWIWIELIGFDNTLSDYGVGAYMENAGFVPDAMSLLLFTSDFIHTHDGMAVEKPLPPEVCSYGARPYGKSRMLQSWTNLQLRGLVRELQRAGTQVYCSFFDMFQTHNPERLRPTEWCAAHPELYEMRRSGEAFRVINPLRRLRDGTYYEDLFVRDLTAVMRDYGFDGYHGADGYTSPRLCIAEIDYSDDMTGQFEAYMQQRGLAAGFELACEGDPEAMERRAAQIWSWHRLAWIDFHAGRWAELWRKIMTALKADGKKAVLNTAWTRDPFEAMYRYGVDYKRLAACGIDGFVVEAGAAALSSGGEDWDYEPCTEFMATILSLKAYMPDVQLICLNAIHDTYEQWDVLNHAPTLLDRDILCFSNLYLYDQNGIRRCTEGFVACLGDDVAAHGWARIERLWAAGYDGLPERTLGASFVWSDAVLHRSLADYADRREWPVHKLVHEWLERGAPLHSVVNVRDLGAHEGVIIVTHAHLLPETELSAVLGYRGGSVLLAGRRTDTLSVMLHAAGLAIPDIQAARFCAIRSANGSWLETIREEPVQRAAPERDKAINDSHNWLVPLYYAPIEAPFHERIVQALLSETGAPRPTKNEADIRLTALRMSASRWRILIRNLAMNYKIAQLDLRRPIRRIETLTDFPGVPVLPEGHQVRLSVPGRGMVAIEADFY
ncbi:hypothetical protein ACFSR7_03025 [Cohnella sp. GCM10020058]|uniref:hypothetical protein n=1 Tax=Cohnella sp. GCM10020058 TaxID=3317330 RepID=UPI00362F92D4